MFKLHCCLVIICHILWCSKELLKQWTNNHTKLFVFSWAPSENNHNKKIWVGEEKGADMIYVAKILCESKSNREHKELLHHLQP